MTTASSIGAMQPYALTLDRFLDHAAKWHGATEVVTVRLLWPGRMVELESGAR